MASFDVTRLTGTGQLFDQIAADIDNLKLVIPYYNQVLTDIGVNNDFELGDLMVQDCYDILNIIDIMTDRLENIRYGTMPCPPCHTGPTGPIGWATCVTGP